MKKYISVLLLPAFLLGAWTYQNTTEHALADVPIRTDCPAGSMRLNYGDGSTTVTNSSGQPIDPWAPVPPPAPNPNPAPAVNWDDYLDDEVIERYNRNPRFRNNENVNQALNTNLINKTYAQGPGEDEDRGGNGGGQALGGGPVCASWRNYSTSVAELACIVMQEQGGGPFCMAPNSNIIYNGLTDNSCRRVQGTQLAGFRIVATFPNYACGVPSPVTDG